MLLFHHLFTPLEMMLIRIWQLIVINCMEETGSVESNKPLAFPQVLETRESWSRCCCWPTTYPRGGWVREVWSPYHTTDAPCLPTCSLSVPKLCYCLLKATPLEHRNKTVTREFLQPAFHPRTAVPDPIYDLGWQEHPVEAARGIFCLLFG